jgi:hypothetical protein
MLCGSLLCIAVSFDEVLDAGDFSLALTTTALGKSETLVEGQVIIDGLAVVGSKLAGFPFGSEGVGGIRLTASAPNHFRFSINHIETIPRFFYLSIVYLLWQIFKPHKSKRSGSAGFNDFLGLLLGSVCRSVKGQRDTRAVFENADDFPNEIAGH